MSRQVRPSPPSFVRNLFAGSYGPVERVRLIVTNAAATTATLVVE